MKQNSALQISKPAFHKTGLFCIIILISVLAVSCDTNTLVDLLNATTTTTIPGATTTTVDGATTTTIPGTTTTTTSTTITPNADIYETDDTSTDTITNTMLPDQPVQIHTFHTADDEDWIKLDLTGITAGETVIIKTYYYLTFNDTLIQLYDSTFTYISGNDDYHADDKFSRYSFVCNTPDIYYIRVSEFTNSTGWYSIEVRTIPEDTDIYEPDDTTADTANEIVPDDVRQYHTLLDIDWIILNCTAVTPGTDIKIETYYMADQGTNTELYLYDATFTEIAVNSNKSGSDEYSKIIFTCNTPGFYYIMVDEGEGSGYWGSYSIDVLIQ